MSNEVGPLYRNVIAGVIRDARADFEDLGEDATVLEMLRKEWRKRLSDMKITGDRPWDETEVRAPVYLPPLGQLGSGQNSSAPGTVSGSATGPRPAGQSSLYPNGGGPGGSADGNSNGSSAGSGAGSTDAGGMPNLFVKNEPTNLYVKSEPTNVYAKQEPANSSGGMPDLPASLRTGSNGQSQANPPLPQSVRDMMMQADDNDDGVRLQANPPPETQQMPQVGLSSELRQQLESVMSKEGNRQNLRQTDGVQDEEVNSDLDDSEDDDINNEEEDDGEQSQIMLCLYDKVQRVKNKWKYTLKDGVANVNGLDYVFSKATGESEW